MKVGYSRSFKVLNTQEGFYVEREFPDDKDLEEAFSELIKELLDSIPKVVSNLDRIYINSQLAQESKANKIRAKRLEGFFNNQ